MDIQKIDLKSIVQHCINHVFRTTTDKDGFVLLDFGSQIDSFQLRAIMVDLKVGLSQYTKAQFNKTLSYQWLGRFDQQVSTKYHLDNAGDQSFLMLGYEPSEIESELFLADYVQFSQNNDTNPADYFNKFNPIFKDNETVLKPYIKEVKPFNTATYKIVLINNSNSMSDCETLGVLHMARIKNPDLSKSRVINSMMLSMLKESEIVVNEISVEDFKTTNLVSK